MSSREDRVGENEALFRQVNERVADIVVELNEAARGLDIFCECGEQACMEKVLVDLSLYEKVRENPLRFIVEPGHQVPEIETVVEEHEHLLVVEKEGEAAAVARVTDPRS